MTASVVLPRSDDPRVSVVILAWRHEELLRGCLASVAAAAGHAVPFEVIIVLNGATPGVSRVVDQDVIGARVVRSEVNLGFAGGCNLARTAARGDFILLLNDDTEVQPGWMDALVRTLDDHPEAGAVGSRILFADDTVQEAGCVIWNDGSTATVGRGAPDAIGEYLYLRAVDYCSACSLMVRTTTWDAVGGLDERYFPGYYEDADLCLAINEIGQRVLYQPASRVRHHESASLESDYKVFVFDRCKAAFIEKWRSVLPRYLSPYAADAMDRAVQRARGSRRVLVIDDRLPSPSAGSGFGRMYETITELMRAGWCVSVHPSDIAGADAATMGAIGVEVVGELDTHLRRSSTSYDAVIVSRPNNFERFAPLVRAAQPGATLVYDAEAIYHRRLALQVGLAEHSQTADALRARHAEMVELERSIAADADAVVAISEEEAAVFRSVPGHAPVAVRSPLSWTALPTSAEFTERRGLLFVAGWLSGVESPNADGLRWFVRAVAPILRARLPWLTLLVTGADPPASMRAMGSPTLRFAGHVPDLAAAYGGARVVIAPVRYGAGVKIKVVEAIEHGVPVVTTSVGADGVPPSVRRVIRIADDPRQFAADVIELVSSREAWEAERAQIATAREEALAVTRPSWPSLLRWAGDARRTAQVRAG